MSHNGSITADEFVRSLHLFVYLARFNMEERFVNEVSDSSISFVQMNLMRVLGLQPGQTVGDVAKFMSVSYPAATKTIDKLVRLGYVKRKEDVHDRRIAHLYLTNSGQKVIDKYIEFKENQITRVLDRYGKEKSIALNENLLDFARALVDEMNTDSTSCQQCGAFDPMFCNAGSNPDCGFLTELGKPARSKT